MENWEALDIKRDGSLSLRAGLIEGGGHSCGVVVAAAYLCRRAVERWSARPSVEVSRPVLWNPWSSARPRSRGRSAVSVHCFESADQDLRTRYRGKRV